MQTLLVLNIDPAAEDDLVDYLLGLDSVDGFTSFPARGHGRHGSALSVAEQVTGRRKRVQFELVLDHTVVPAVLENLRADVGRDITWWQSPIDASGRID